jgi:hypothetical protein
MPYDDPSLKQFENYYLSHKPSERERAENWAIAIGLQKVDGLTPSAHLISVAKKHIEGKISSGKAVQLVDRYYETKSGHDAPKTKGGQKKVVRKKRSEKSGQKTVDKLLALLMANPHLTQEGMVNALMVTRSTIQKHLANLKSAGRLRRVGPDKGGHWEVVE